MYKELGRSLACYIDYMNYLGFALTCLINGIGYTKAQNVAIFTYYAMKINTDEIFWIMKLLITLLDTVSDTFTHIDIGVFKCYSPPSTLFACSTLELYHYDEALT